MDATNSDERKNADDGHVGDSHEEREFIEIIFSLDFPKSKFLTLISSKEIINQKYTKKGNTLLHIACQNYQVCSV